MSRSLPALVSTTAPIGSTDAYIARANDIPMLSSEEEQRLAQDWFDNQNTESARKLIMSHLRFVVRIARGYSGYGLQLADLIQEGNVGLMKAVKRFNPNVGVRLVSFAVHWIKSEIHEFIIRNWRVVKIATTKSQRKLFFNLRSMKSRLGWFTEEEVQGVASELGVSAADVREMENRLNAYDASFDLPNDESDEGTPGKQISPVLYLEDHSMDPATLHEEAVWKKNHMNNLSEALSALKPRERMIIESRWLADSKLTLHELADKLDISAERVRQIEKSAMKKIKAAMHVEDE